MKLPVILSLFFLLSVPGILAVTIEYVTPVPSLNATVQAGTGILITGNSTNIIINFDEPYGDLRYYPYSSNPAGYLTSETDPIFTAENASIWNAINNISLTPGPPGANGSTGPQGPSGLNGTNGLDANLSNIHGNNSVIVIGNSTELFLSVNETWLNATINNLASIDNFSVTIPVNVIAGDGLNITPVIGFKITQIIITPPTLSNMYRVQVQENISGAIIDRDRIPHIGVWSIEKSYVLNDSVLINITSASIDETFNATIKYLNNGVI